MRRSLFRHMLLGACLSAPFLLVGCSSDEGAPQTFPPLSYTYLAPISLNVSAIQTEVPYVPSQDGTNLDSVSPEAPVQAVEQMLQDRLVAGGNSGKAIVTVNTASLNRLNDTVVGNVSVQVAVASADGRQTGYTQASVTRSRTLPDDTSDNALRAFLYTMTSDLVNAENVELEYQIRQHLAGWQVGGSSSVIGGPAAPTPVESEPLSGPGAPVVGPPVPGAPAPLGAPEPLGQPAPASMSIPSSAPAMPSTMPPMPMPMPMTPPAGQPQQDDSAPTMPSGDLGLPQGNPVPLAPAPATEPSPAEQLVAPQPPAASIPVTPAPTPVAPPSPAPAPAPAPAANPATLPPLPPTITP